MATEVQDVIAKVAEVQVVGPETKAENLTDAEFLTVLDSYVELSSKLEKKLETLKPLQAGVAQLEKLIKDRADMIVTEDEKVTFDASTSTIEVSAKSKKTEIISMETVKELLGVETFMQIATVTLTNLKQYLSGKQYESVTKTSFEGSRRIKKEKKLKKGKIS